jgi:hypothetical protein
MSGFLRRMQPEVGARDGARIHPQLDRQAAGG